MIGPADKIDAVTMHTWARALAVGGTSAALLALVAAPVHAEDPFAMSDRVVDRSTAQVAAASTAELVAAADDVVAETDFDLWTVYVDSFDGARPVDWANETAIASDADTDVLLLAIAVEDGEVALSVAEEAGISDAAVSDVEAAARQEVADEDWVGASLAAADTIIELATGVAPSPDPEDEADGGANSAVPWVVGGVAVVAIVGGIALTRRRRGGDGGAQQPGGGAAPQSEWAALSTEELGTRAGSALVALDNDVRSSANELAFAEAQFGLEATKDFKATLAQAQQQLGQAFAIQQQLGDATPESEDAKRQGLIQILELCRAADAALDSQTEALAQLRALQDRAPEVLAELEQRAGELAARIPAARDTLRHLGATYPATALATVSKAPDQADALIVSARQSITEGTSRVQAGDRGTAVAYARTAEDALQQVGTLLDMVADAGRTLEEAAQQLDGAIASLTSDVSDAGRLAPNDATIAPAVQRAQAAIEAGTAAKNGGDPIAALAELAAAEQALDAALAPRREQEQVSTRLAAQLVAQIGAADQTIARANAYIETNRGAIGPDARTRLASAVERLARARALQQEQPQEALATAQSAAEMAADAERLARQDVGRWSSGYERAGSGGYYGRSGGIDAGSLVLGGILNEMLGGGGSSGGSSWGGGGSWGGSGGWGGSRSRGGGSIGRSMGSVSRSGSRRSGGGSRRSGGGRRR